MELTPQPAPYANPPGEKLVEYIRTNRQNASTGLLVVAVVFLLLGGWSVIRANRTSSLSKETEAGKKADEKKGDLNAFNLDETPAKVSDPNQVEYMGAAISAGGLFLIAAIGGLWLIVSTPPLSDQSSGRRSASCS